MFNFFRKKPKTLFNEAALAVLAQKLRGETGEGLMHCRYALKACDYDVERAKALLAKVSKYYLWTHQQP